MSFFGLFGRKKTPSAEYAKNRVNFQIHCDRAGVNPELLENIKKDIFVAISKHIEYDHKDVDINFEKSSSNRSVLTASIPITRLRRNEPNKRK